MAAQSSGCRRRLPNWRSSRACSGREGRGLPQSAVWVRLVTNSTGKNTGEALRPDSVGRAGRAPHPSDPAATVARSVPLRRRLGVPEPLHETARRDVTAAARRRSSAQTSRCRPNASAAASSSSRSQYASRVSRDECGYGCVRMWCIPFGIGRTFVGAIPTVEKAAEMGDLPPRMRKRSGSDLGMLGQISRQGRTQRDSRNRIPPRIVVGAPISRYDVIDVPSVDRVAIGSRVRRSVQWICRLSRADWADWRVRWQRTSRCFLAGFDAGVTSSSFRPRQRGRSSMPLAEGQSRRAGAGQSLDINPIDSHAGAAGPLCGVRRLRCADHRLLS